MNEVTRIHLGREPFSISVEAHKVLKAYLADIEKNVDDPEVVNEVELRMSELLIEHGVAGDKVILPKDVEYLKAQLGDPDDFSDDDKQTTENPLKSDEKSSRKLFRDTDSAIIGGVAAGFASYSGMDPIIFRLLFVVLAVSSFGFGIILYLVLWLILPPAETTSEKLQMRGKPVTLEALKDSVNRADINGAAQRINGRILPVINGIFSLIVKVVGVGFIFSGLAIMSIVSVARIYMSLHNGRLFQENLFPVGVREEWLLALVMGLGVIVAIFLLLIGVASFKRKWPVGAWITGILAGIFLMCSVASIALAADAVPRIHERYETGLHTTAISNIQPFNKIVTTGGVDIAYISSPNYAVNVHYFGHADLSKLKINVTNKTLHVNSTHLDALNHCTMLCLFPRYDMTVQIYAPNIKQFVTPPQTEIFYPNMPAAPVMPASSMLPSPTKN